MWPDGVVVQAPPFDHDVRLEDRVEDLAAQQLVAHLPIEGFAETVLSGASRLNEEWSDLE